MFGRVSFIHGSSPGRRAEMHAANVYVEFVVGPRGGGGWSFLFGRRWAGGSVQWNSVSHRCSCGKVCYGTQATVTMYVPRRINSLNRSRLLIFQFPFKYTIISWKFHHAFQSLQLSHCLRFIMRQRIIINHKAKKKKTTMKWLRKYENKCHNTKEKKMNKIPKAWPPHICHDNKNRIYSIIMQHYFKSCAPVIYIHHPHIHIQTSPAEHSWNAMPL